MEKFKKYREWITLVLVFFLFIKSCGTSSKLEKIEDKTVALEEKIDLTYNKIQKDLQIEGLKSEKRMIQATDRRMLDVQRQSEIDKEIEGLKK
jgi:hypothetical protein